MFFSPSSQDSIRKYVARVALEVTLNDMILAGLIIRPLVGQLAGQLVNIEPQLLIATPLLRPHFGSHCPRSPKYTHSLGPGSSLFLISACIAIIGSFMYALLRLGISIPRRDEKKQVQATLGIIFIKCAFFRASKVIREYTERLLRTMAAYSGKTLRACLEIISRHPGFQIYLGVITRLFISMINKLKMITTCLFFFGLGVVVAMAFYHSQSLLTYAHIASDLTHREATTIKLRSILTSLLFFAGLRFLILSCPEFLFSRKMEAQKLWSKAFLLVNKGESAILVGDEGTDVVLNSNIGDVGEDEPRDVNIQVQEAVLVTNSNSFKQQREAAAISNVYSATEDSKNVNGPDRSEISLPQQQKDKLNSVSNTSLSATSPEFVPRFRSTIPVPARDSCPSYWALAPPVSVRITAPVKRHRIRRDACPTECGNAGV